MDDITTVKPATTTADTSPPAELPANKKSTTIQPLDLVQSPKVRTKLQIYAILIALYVRASYPPLIPQRAHTIQLTIYHPARPLHSSPRSNHHRNLNPHHIRRSALRFRLHLDRRRVRAGQSGRGSDLGQMQRHLGSEACALGSSRDLCRC